MNRERSLKWDGTHDDIEKKLKDFQGLKKFQASVKVCREIDLCPFMKTHLRALHLQIGNLEMMV